MRLIEGDILRHKDGREVIIRDGKDEGRYYELYATGFRKVGEYYIDEENTRAREFEYRYNFYSLQRQVNPKPRDKDVSVIEDAKRKPRIAVI
jgi:hypothetical protein